MEPVIKGHPLHPALITLPVGLLSASYILDVLAVVTDNDTLAEASYYNMVLGFIGATPAAITGFLDYSQMEQKDPAHKTTTTHGLMNAGLIGLYGLNLLIRRNNKRSLWGFLLSTVGASALGVSAYLGGEIAYGRGWRVRSAERFELEWQKTHKTGPFAEEGHAATSTETEYPPEVIKAFTEKKSGTAVFEEIKNDPTIGGSEPTKIKASGKNGKVTPSERPEPAIALDASRQNLDDNKPSQAEGDRDEIESDLNNQGGPIAQG